MRCGRRQECQAVAVGVESARHGGTDAAARAGDDNDSLLAVIPALS